MKIKKVILFVISILIYCSCSSQEIKTVETPTLSFYPSQRIPFHNNKIYGKVEFSCYEIVNKDSVFLRPIKILNIDSLKYRIKYPGIAKRAGVGGNVLIELKLGSTGEIESMKAVSNIGASLEESVLNSLKGFRFKFKEASTDKDISILLIVSFNIVNSLPVKVY